MVALIQEANRQVYERAREDADASGMGTTITVALFENGSVVDRPRRRLARLPAPRRRGRPADRRPLARRGARPQRPAVARGSRVAPAALRDHARARNRPGRRRRHVLGRGEAGRPVPDLLRRAHVDGRRRGDPRASSSSTATTSSGREGARRRGQPRRRRGQHHGRLLRGRRRRRRRTPGETKPMPALGVGAAAADRRGHARPRLDGVPASTRWSSARAGAPETQPTRAADRKPSRRRRARRRAARLVIALAVVAGLALLVSWLLGRSHDAAELPQPRARQPLRRRAC